MDPRGIRMLSVNLWRVATDRGKRCPLGAPEDINTRNGVAFVSLSIDLYVQHLMSLLGVRYRGSTVHDLTGHGRGGNQTHQQTFSMQISVPPWG